MYVAIITNGREKKAIGPFYTWYEANDKVKQGNLSCDLGNEDVSFVPYEILWLEPCFTSFNDPPDKRAEQQLLTVIDQDKKPHATEEGNPNEV